jgi:hypothetical protein
MSERRIKHPADIVRGRKVYHLADRSPLVLQENEKVLVDLDRHYFLCEGIAFVLRARTIVVRDQNSPLMSNMMGEPACPFRLVRANTSAAVRDINKFFAGQAIYKAYELCLDAATNTAFDSRKLARFCWSDTKRVLHIDLLYSVLHCDGTTVTLDVNTLINDITAEWGENGCPKKVTLLAVYCYLKQ